MKKIVIIGLSLILAMVSVAAVALAWGPGFGRGFGMGPGYGPPGGSLSPIQAKSACRIDPSITFTEEQTEKLAHLQRAYLEEAKPLWRELRDLRFELRFAVSDPRVQPQALLDKQRKFSALQARLENLLFSYQVKARDIFTKEQFERFPVDCPLKKGVGYKMGRGLERGPRKGIR
jgi:hypothetical protein